MKTGVVWRMTRWACLWSPLASRGEHAMAWRSLGLPESGPGDDFPGLFHTGIPSPRVPLLFHTALGIPGDGAREDWMRVMNYLNLEWKDRVLPPDHLAVACDVIAWAASRGETLLVSELVSRYLLRWCIFAGERLGDDYGVCAALPARFEQDLESLVQLPEYSRG